MLRLPDTVFRKHGKQNVICNESFDDAQNDVSSNFDALNNSPSEYINGQFCFVSCLDHKNYRLYYFSPRSSSNHLLEIQFVYYFKIFFVIALERFLSGQYRKYKPKVSYSK